MKSYGTWKNTENIGVYVKILSHIFSRDESVWTGIERRGGYIYKIFPGLKILTQFLNILKSFVVIAHGRLHISSFYYHAVYCYKIRDLSS